MKRIFALLVLCLLVLPLCVGSALAVDLEKSCSLTVKFNIEGSDADPEAAGLVVDLYKVADAVPVRGYDTYTFQLNEQGFYYNHIYGQDLSEALAQAASGSETTDWEAVAQLAFQMATGHINPNLIMGYEDTPVVAAAPIGDKITLDAGLYLAVARSADLENYLEWISEEIDATNWKYSLTSIAKDANYKYRFSPLLISLPAPNDGAVSAADAWCYDAEVNLKVGLEAFSQKKLLLHKVGEDGKTPLEGATFDLYATRVASNELPGETITTYVEGQGYVTLYRIAQNLKTDSNGNIELVAPLWDDNTLYAWVETQAPAGYELDPTPRFFFAYAVGEYTSEVYNGYADYMNYKGADYKPRLHYDPDYPNATGSVTFDRWLRSNYNVVQLSNAADGQPVYIRVKAFSSSEGYYNGVSLGSYTLEASGEGWTLGEDGYYYYDEILDGGEMTPDLRFLTEPDYGERIQDDNGMPLPYLARLAVVYDIVPVQYDGNGKPYADWNMIIGEDEDAWLSAGLQTQATAAGRGGYVIIGDQDVKYIAQKHFVFSSYYEGKNSEFNEPVKMINKKRNENPPDEPGLELPETGGMGTVAFTLAGSGIVVIAAFLLAVKKNRRA